ncbi:hypothetical protein HDIA_0742 [Hartmannibacter diazotrophicus]|uniref:Uncharacterized protein n=1 Tax=Hartmannibacter diazotrophicus TaxID=1482074 RepID=A0A2C9D239_9HYPH|nr:hypothetical protein [Hartmannibacter diazotrophicus]SON54283.1 hypothetical protein HDIA_0742 [Hartmannibacter diazotrophicus]
MKIFSDEDGKGDTVIVLSKDDGKALVRALEVATTRKPAAFKALAANSKAYQIARKIELNLPVF